MTRLPDALGALDADGLEAWFLSAVESDAPPVDELLAVLEHLAATGRKALARSWAELLQDTLAERRLDTDAVRLLRLRVGWARGAADQRALCVAVAGGLRTRLGKAFVKAVPPDGALPPELFLARIGKLFDLQPGRLCLDGTWGFGVVKRLDDFYGKVTIDFTRKPRHELSFAYAAETLDLLDDEHLLARLHRDPDGMLRLVETDPAEIVRLALRSYGPRTLDQFEELLTGAGVVPAGKWKSFWSGARRGLKDDPLVEVPTKRSVPLRLRDAPRQYDMDWFATFGELREPAKILEALQELEQAGQTGRLDAPARDILADRLEFVVWGDDRRRPSLVVQALLAADRLGLVDDDGRLGPRGIGIADTLDKLLAGARAAKILEGAPSRSLPALLDLAARRCADTLQPVLLKSLGRLGTGTLDAVVTFLVGQGGREAVVETLRASVKRGALSPAQVLWLLKSADADLVAAVLTPAELLLQAVECLEHDASGEQLRARNQIRALFENGAWMAERLHGLSRDETELLLQRVRLSRGGDEVGRRTVIAGIVKAVPELVGVLTSGADTGDASPRGRFTSWRTYRERQTALKRLVEEEIPSNAREIGVARSYGDLRENAEFKYAKEHQRILYRRRDEYEADLNAVQGTDFKGVPSDQAGMGTCVTIRYADEREETFCILGEWDRDEALGIISNQSGLALALEGHGPGDTVEIPSAAGPTTCTVVTVSGLSDAVQAWLATA